MGVWHLVQLFNFLVLVVILAIAVIVGVHYYYHRERNALHAVLWGIVALFFPIGPILYYISCRDAL